MSNKTTFVKLVFNTEADLVDLICDLPNGSYIELNDVTLLMTEKSYNELHEVFYDTVELLEFKYELNIGN